jgi:cell division protein FtsB
VLRWLIPVLAALLLLIQWPLWFGKGGWFRVWDLERQLLAQRAANDSLSAQIASLAAEARSLKEGREAVEERARSELGMIRSDETFFQLVVPAAAASSVAAASSAPSARPKSQAPEAAAAK